MQRPSEAMNYYDELGLSATASTDEIKEAYRTLMRLLHPDLQRDPELQRAADLQVKKLNRIYAILSDPDRRRRYDQDLAGDFERSTPIIIHAPPPPSRQPFIRRSSVAWVTAVTAFAVLLIWMASRPVPVEPVYNSGASVVEPVPGRIPAPVKAAPPKPPLARSDAPARHDAPARSDAQSVAEAEKLRANLARALDERDAALAEADKLRSQPPAAKLEHSKTRAEEVPPTIVKLPERRAVFVPDTAPELKPEPLPPPVLVAKAAPAPAAVEPSNPMSGTWFYRPPETPSKNKDLYPPEFIETSITEENGQLRGTYHARYKVPNRPVAPDVSFQFAGAFSGDSGSLPWSGSGGSKGEVTITLMANHSLRIDWVANQLGALGFYRGTAVLVKRAD